MNEATKNEIGEIMMMQYAAGQLPEAFEMVVASHLELCEDARIKAMGYEAIGGAVLDDMSPVALKNNAFEAIMKAIENECDDDFGVPLNCNVLPDALANYCPKGIEGVKWRSLGNGAQQSILLSNESGTARLLKIPENTSMPDHGHHGIEATLVLKGAFRDGEQRFVRGDIAVANPEVHHQPKVEDDGECVCLVATNAPLRIEGILPRLLQPFFKI